AQEHANAANQIDRANNCALLAINLLERAQMGSTSLSPKPDLCGWSRAAFDSGQIDRMAHQHFPAPEHDVFQQITPGSSWQMVLDWPIGNVMRRLRPRFLRERSNISAAIDKDIAITNSGIKLQCAASAAELHRTTQLFLQSFHKGFAISSCYMSCCEV